ncbi:MAG: Hsp33 family molecular chaperone HslO [Robiginitomaculum sp.]|nr:Hsp33 family molecular chaperone HslO [Robiginitomaculum sp.]
MSEHVMHDNQTAPVRIGDGQVRGRVIRLGDVLDAALGHDRYPPAVARILGEAILISALVARTLKFEGRLFVQAHGTNDGAISMLTAECTTGGDVRAYARFDQSSLARILGENQHPDAHTLLGGGTFAMTIDQGKDMDRYQGLSAIEGESLGDCAEHYFAQSEQIPTRVKLAVGQHQMAGQELKWRGGGLMVQRIAGDSARGDASEAWDMAKAVMATVSAAELLDPDLSSDNLLYRLFHEQGVSRLEPKDIFAQCSCSRDRLHNTLKSFDAAAIGDMMKDGKITANCEYCGTDYTFAQADL